MLERHNIPGGCATSFVRGVFEFEVALHQLSGLGTEKQPFIMRQIFKDLGVMDKVEFIQESDLYRMVVNDELIINRAKPNHCVFYIPAIAGSETNFSLLPPYLEQKPTPTPKPRPKMAANAKPLMQNWHISSFLLNN